jgi:hypothetical protein
VAMINARVIAVPTVLAPVSSCSSGLCAYAVACTGEMSDTKVLVMIACG